MTTGLPSTRSPVLRGPPELATSNVFPLFDFLGGSISGKLTLSISFLIFAFIFFAPFCGFVRSSLVQSIKPFPNCEAKIGLISAIATRMEWCRQRFSPHLVSVSRQPLANRFSPMHRPKPSNVWPEAEYPPVIRHRREVPERRAGETKSCAR